MLNVPAVAGRAAILLAPQSGTARQGYAFSFGVQAAGNTSLPAPLPLSFPSFHLLAPPLSPLPWSAALSEELGRNCFCGKSVRIEDELILWHFVRSLHCRSWQREKQRTSLISLWTMAPRPTWKRCIGRPIRLPCVQRPLFTPTPLKSWPQLLQSAICLCPPLPPLSPCTLLLAGGL